VSGVVFAETLRRHVRHGAYLTAMAVLAILAATAGSVGGNPSLWLTFVTLGTIIIGCQLIGPEFSSGTLQLVLAKPVNRSAYLLSRFAAVVVAAWILVILPMLFDVLARIFVQHQELHSADFAVPVNTGIENLMLCALLALFGAMTRSYLNVALYFLGEITLYALDSGLRSIARHDYAPSSFLRDHPAIEKGVVAIIRTLYPEGPPTFDWRWTVTVVSNVVVALLLACLVFRRREVPYGAD